jgi:hypothetical protein
MANPFLQMLLRNTWQACRFPHQSPGTTPAKDRFLADVLEEPTMQIIRNLLLAGAASVLLSAAAQASSSTASEREQTRQLNLQAAQQSSMPLQPASATDAASAGVPVFAPIALNSLSSPPDKIATATVVDQSGAVVGAVQKVDLDASGKPAQVEIALLGTDRIVALDSARLSYDQSHNVMTAALDKSQIAQLPAAPQG